MGIRDLLKAMLGNNEARGKIIEHHAKAIKEDRRLRKKLKKQMERDRQREQRQRDKKR
jgi:hypothetical protein